MSWRDAFEILIEWYAILALLAFFFRPSRVRARDALRPLARLDSIKAARRWRALSCAPVARESESASSRFRDSHTVQGRALPRKHETRARFRISE
jgi:hypothetical protein